MSKDTPLITSDMRAAIRRRLPIAASLVAVWAVSGCVFLLCVVANVSVGALNVARVFSGARGSASSEFATVQVYQQATVQARLQATRQADFANAQATQQAEFDNAQATQQAFAIQQQATQAARLQAPAGDSGQQPTPATGALVPPPTPTNLPTPAPLPTEPEPTATPLSTSSSAASDSAQAAPIPPDDITLVQASGIARSSQDNCQRTTNYNPENVKDGNLETAWRVEGSGADAWIQLTFKTPVRVTELRIVPGLVKVDRCNPNRPIDRFPQGYRASVVELAFSDGTTVRGDLQDRPEAQPITFPPVTSQWVRVTIRETRRPSASGANPYAAISEIGVTGSVQ